MSCNSRPRPGLPARLITWLAVRSRTAPRAERYGIVTLAVIAVVLGSAGFERSSSDLNPLDVAYGVAAMFVLSGTNASDDLPIELQVARLLAPLATAGATLSLLARLGRGRLNAAAGERLAHHLVLIGPATRVLHHAARATQRFIVHHTDQACGAIAGAVHSERALAGSNWLSFLSADRADRIVISPGNDDVAVALLGPALHLVDMRPDLEVVVEVDDSATAAAVAILLIADKPAAHVQVVCPDDLAAEMAAAHALNIMRSTLVRRTPELTEPGFGSTVVLVGDGDRLLLLGKYVSESLRRTYPGGGRAPRPVLWMVARDQSVRGQLRDTITDPVNLDLHVCADVADVSVADTAVISVLACERREDNLPAAVRFKAIHPTADVSVWDTSTDLPLGLVPLNMDSAGNTIHFGGPWARAAAMCFERTEGGSWSDLRPDEQRVRTAQLRLALSRLIAAGWRLSPRHGAWDGDVVLPLAAMAAIGDHSHEWRDLPWMLPTVGFALHAASSHATAFALHPRSMLDDTQVDQLARSSHETYRSSMATEHAEGPSTSPSQMSWGELETQYRAQNIQQIRHAVMQLEAIGLAIVAKGSTAPAVRVDPDDAVIECLARAEHSRWARLKLAQGFRFAPTLDVARRLHPDLVAWEDLDGEAGVPEARREKDRMPMRTFIAGLGKLDLCLVRGSRPDAGE